MRHLGFYTISTVNGDRISGVAYEPDEHGVFKVETFWEDTEALAPVMWINTRYVVSASQQKGTRARDLAYLLLGSRGDSAETVRRQCGDT